MRLIPVIDLLDGCAVHAIRGDRGHYRPVKSVLCNTSNPLELAKAYRDRLGLNEIYIADLNAIQGSPQVKHGKMIGELIQREGMLVVLDAGTTDVAGSQCWLDLGVHRVVIGTETLHTWSLLKELPARVDRNRLTFSLDLCAGSILSRCPDLNTLSPWEVLDHVRSAGWQEILVLDLRRVGSEDGADSTMAAKIRMRFPDISLLLGGGIADPAELAELKALGVTGVLLATALHQGKIVARHISILGGRSRAS
jgi:phosphoribosylformimino-5-aminoimidazole carboxamide ribotide isomerase